MSMVDSDAAKNFVAAASGSLSHASHVSRDSV